MRLPLVWLLGVSGAVILGIATWSSWPSPALRISLPDRTLPQVEANDMEQFVVEMRDVAREFMADSPELRETVLKVASALGADAGVVDLVDEHRHVEAQIALARDEEQVLRHRVAQLTAETARLERISHAQRQLVADLMNEWAAAQERSNRGAEVRGFSLSILANWVSGFLLLIGAWLFNRFRPSTTSESVRPVRRR